MFFGVFRGRRLRQRITLLVFEDARTALLIWFLPRRQVLVFARHQVFKKYIPLKSMRISRKEIVLLRTHMQACWSHGSLTEGALIWEFVAVFACEMSLYRQLLMLLAEWSYTDFRSVGFT